MARRPVPRELPPVAHAPRVITLARTVDRHRPIARWTYPVWLYVSVTGVVIYVMLYHLYV
ncbi:MAG: DUF420 domain-containing protein [Acidimicrobiia bacterium]